VQHLYFIYTAFIAFYFTSADTLRTESVCPTPNYDHHLCSTDKPVLCFTLIILQVKSTGSRKIILCHKML